MPELPVHRSVGNAMSRSTHLAGVVAAAGLVALGACGRQEEPPPPWPSAVYPEAVWNFGEVVQGERLEHGFVVENRGLQELRIESVEVPEVLTVEGYDELIPPGGRGTIRLSMDTSGRSGSGRLDVEIATNDPDRPTHVLAVEGRLVPLVEIQPQDRVYFFDVAEGRSAEKEVLVVNHQERPLSILAVSPGDPSYFETGLETVEEGQQYRLTIKLGPATPAGKIEETISVSTDSPEFPDLLVQALAEVRKPVDVQPRTLEFSRVLYDALARDALAERELRVSAYTEDSFRVLEASTDLPYIKVEIEVEEPGKSYLLRVRLDRERAPRGEIGGTLVIRTDHPDHPELQVPISGTIL